MTGPAAITAIRAPTDLLRKEVELDAPSSASPSMRQNLRPHADRKFLHPDAIFLCNNKVSEFMCNNKNTQKYYGNQ